MELMKEKPKLKHEKKTHSKKSSKCAEEKSLANFKQKKVDICLEQKDEATNLNLRKKSIDSNNVNSDIITNESILKQYVPSNQNKTSNLEINCAESSQSCAQSVLVTKEALVRTEALSPKSVVQSDLVKTESKASPFVNAIMKQNERVVPRSIYPNLKNMEYCEKMEEIATIQTLVQTYTEEYFNKTYMDAVKSHQEFHMALTGVERYPLFELVKEYQMARKRTTDIHVRMKYLNSKLNIEKDNLWKLVKKDVSLKGQCHDGNSVSISHSYHIKELDTDKFNEVMEVLRELEEITLSDAYYSYLDHLSNLKIEQYIFNVLTLDDSSDGKGTSNSSIRGPNKIVDLKNCISILFMYQRQSIRDKEFLEICQKWLKILVYKLLQNTPAEFLFVLNHIIRCPNGIQNWASRLFQLPISEFCPRSVTDSFGCRCLYNVLLVLYLVLVPAPDRDSFLKNVRGAKSVSSDPAIGEFVMLDSDGEEEELFEVVKEWSSDDVISLLNQIPVSRLYGHLLLENKNKDGNIGNLSKDMIIRMFAFSTALSNILLTGLKNYKNEDFSAAIECICSIIRHTVCYVSDLWTHYMNANTSSDFTLQAEYDRFFFHVVFSIFVYKKFGVWKFLSVLPFKCISKKMLWNILWSFHSINKSEEYVYLEKDVDIKLRDAQVISHLVKNLKEVNQPDQVYLLNVYKSIVLHGNKDEELLSFIVHELLEVAFVEISLRHLSKESRIILVSIIKKYPNLMTVLLKEIGKKEDEVINFSIPVFEELNLKKWQPIADDINIFTDWLLNNPLSDPKNFVARMLLAKMNWSFSTDGTSILPVELHREVAVLVLQAYMKFDSKGNEWSVSRGLTQMLQFATLGNFGREDEGFVSWAWDLLFSLKLHALDEKYPPWVQVYDGYLEVDSLPDPYQAVWLQPLLNGYEERHPAACYLLLVMCNVGHNVRKLMVDGMQCLVALIEQQQYLAVIQSLYYILPFFVKNSDELLAQPQFISVVSQIVVADLGVLSNMKGPVVGAVLHKMAAMMKHQISQAWELTVECATPLLKLWINILLKVLSFQEGNNYTFKDSAKQVHFLLDVLVKMAFMDSYTRSSMMDLLYSFANPLLMPTSPQPSFWNKLFTVNSETCTILKKQTFPDFPWLAWYILRAETKQKHVQDLWYQVQKEMCKENTTPAIALKKASTYLKITQPALECLPVYRWGLQILHTPLSHPALPLMWQQFIYYYFERICIAESQAPCCVGLKYFKNEPQSVILKKLIKRSQDTAEFYRKCIHQSVDSSVQDKKGKTSPTTAVRGNTMKECILNFELCKAFRAFRLWISEENLLLPNLCLSALDPKHCTERLQLIINKDQEDWFDLVSVEQLKEDLDQKVHLWRRQKRYIPDEITTEKQDIAFPERITRHLSQSAVKPLPDDIEIRPPIQETEETLFTSWSVLVQSIEKKHNIIFDIARSYTAFADKMKQLNDNYKNLVPQEIFNEDHCETHSKACHKASQCNGSAIFKLKLKRYVTNQRVREKLQSNRIDHRIMQDQLSNLPISQLCYASIHIENYIKDLSKKCQSNTDEGLKFRSLGLSLFYHQIEAVNKAITSVKNYAPSRNFFSTSIEALGNAFVQNQENQLCNLVKAILCFPEAGELAFDLFNPNIASMTVFLEVYEIITSTIKHSPPNTVFVLLNKVDLHYILKEKSTNFSQRRKLFKGICKALVACGSNVPKDLQMVHEVLREHYRLTLEWTFPELYGDGVSFLLEGMESNTLSTILWYDTFHCFGCSTIKESSSLSDIQNSLKKFADNLLLPPDQQIFVSSQPINCSEVQETLVKLHHMFLDKRKSHDLYQVYQLHVKPLGIFMALLSHSLLRLLLEYTDQRQLFNSFHLWEPMHLSFYPWIHPLQNSGSLVFPWSDAQMDDAHLMFQMFTLCVNTCHEKVLGLNCDKHILSYVWTSYVDIYVVPGLRHYLVSVCHLELQNLLWQQFYPGSQDIEEMCTVLQSNLLESKEFLAKISLKVPWIDVMKNISETKSPEYIRRTLTTLGKLLIVSGMDLSLSKNNNHQTNLKALEELSWHFLSLEDSEGLLTLYYSTFNQSTLWSEELQNNPDVHILQFLKIVCGMVASSTVVDQSHFKRLLYLRNYITALNSTVSSNKELILKRPERLKKILPVLLTDIEMTIYKVFNPDQQMSNALPLVREALGFLNSLSDSKLEDIVMESVLQWLHANPRSPLLLPCLQTACQCLNQMTTAVMIIECCISTRFGTDLHDPLDAASMWKLILSNFQVPATMTEEFLHACVNKDAFLTLYSYMIEKMPTATSTENRTLLLFSTIEWIRKCKVKESDEAKCLLLWDKILQLSISLACEDNLQIVKKALLAFCEEISLQGEDRINDGFLGAVGFGRSSSLSVNFRFLCRIISTFLLLQMPSNASLRLQTMDPGYVQLTDNKNFSGTSSKLNDPVPSTAALKAVESLKSLLKNRPYSALRELVESAIEFVLNPEHCLLESRTLLRKYALYVFTKHHYLYALDTEIIT